MIDVNDREHPRHAGQSDLAQSLPLPTLLNEYRWYFAPLHLLRPVGWVFQIGGSGGDAGLDAIKGRAGFKEKVWDEHRRGSINPFHKGNTGHTWLPGLWEGRHHGHHLDFAW